MGAAALVAAVACHTPPPPARDFPPAAPPRGESRPPAPAAEPPIPPPPSVTAQLPALPAPPPRPAAPPRQHQPTVPFTVVGTLPVDSPQWTTDYDGFFRHAADRHFGPVFDWRWWRAQGIAESDLRPNVSSPAGAMGLMQIMPDTWTEIADSVQVSDPWMPSQSIRAGVSYYRMLYDQWGDIPDTLQRMLFAFASYNWGAAEVRRAWFRCDSCRWPAMARHMPTETRRYVGRILRLMAVSP